MSGFMARTIMAAEHFEPLVRDSERMAQQYRAGFAAGKREATWTVAKHGGALIAFGVCVGITLALAFAPAIAWWLL